MFADCFAPDHVAIALRSAGFDEPCMAVHECYELEGKQYSNFIINYSNQPTNPDLYNATIRSAIREHPGVFRDSRKNSDLEQWLYAAPLLDQVLDWLLARGLYLHPYLIDDGWGVNIYDKAHNMVWPNFPFGGNYYEETKVHIHPRKHLALNEAIINALKLLT